MCSKKAKDGENSVLGVPASGGLERIALSDAANSFTEENLSNMTRNPSEYITNTEPQTKEQFALRQTVNDMLLRLRAMNPFLQIMKPPDACNTVTFAAAGALDITIPPNAKFCKIKGNADYYVSFSVTAAVPTAATNLTGDQRGTGSMYKPEDVFFYCEESQSLSVAVPAACIVTVYFYSQQ